MLQATATRERAPEMKKILFQFSKAKYEVKQDMLKLIDKMKQNILPSLLSFTHEINELKQDVKEYSILEKEIDKLKNKGTNDTSTLEKIRFANSKADKLGRQWFDYEKKRLNLLKLFMVNWANCEMFVEAKSVSVLNKSIKMCSGYHIEEDVEVRLGF